MSVAHLTLNVHYDPEVTDSEGLAVALDRLLETALSTPEIFSDYGDPRAGEFLVARSPTIVLNVQGGIVQDVFCSEPEARVITVDWDCDGGEPGDGIVDVAGCGLARVTEESPSPLGALIDRDVERAVTAAGLSLPVCECEYPGYFNCGVPGILAWLENGRLIPGGTVEQCDLCRRYPSDDAALGRLKELGRA